MRRETFCDDKFSLGLPTTTEDSIAGERKSNGFPTECGLRNARCAKSSVRHARGLSPTLFDV